MQIGEKVKKLQCGLRLLEISALAITVQKKKSEIIMFFVSWSKYHAVTSKKQNRKKNNIKRLH